MEFDDASADESPLLTSSRESDYSATGKLALNPSPISSSSVGKSSGSDDGPVEKRYGWFSLRPTCFQSCNSPNGFMVWLCLFALTQSFVTSGIVFAVTTTLEQQFSLPSVQSGFLASCYDLALVVVVLFVTYLGERGNKPLWLGNGALIFSCGSFLFALPQLISESYQPSTLSSDVCELDANTTDQCADVSGPEEANAGLSRCYWVFIAAQCLHGLGAAPIYTLGVTYIDESVSPRMSSIYLGIIQSMSILGPAIGYLLGSFFLSIYVDPSKDPASLGLTPDSVLWVGAWWIGFILSGSLALILATPLMGFPKHLPDAQNIDGKSDQHQTQQGAQFVARPGLGDTMRDLPRATRTLVSNAPFMLLNFGAASEFFIITCLAAFGPKYFESQFSLTSSEASFQAGLIIIPSSFGGTLFGSYIVKHYNMSLSGMVKFCLASLIISLLCMPIFLLSCPDPAMAGATVQYDNTSLSIDGIGGTNFTAECNQYCHCSNEYNPVCGSDHVAYYSACFAGCLTAETPAGVDSDRVYGNCSCITGNGTDDELGGSAVLGVCPMAACNRKTAFMIINFVLLAFTFFALVPSILATMRLVSHSQRAYGLGIQSVIYRAFGTVPGPIVFGALIDKVCNVWETECDGSQTCWLYDNADFSKITFITLVVCRCLTLTFLSTALFCYTPHGVDDDDDDDDDVISSTGLTHKEETSDEVKAKHSDTLLTSQTSFSASYSQP